MVAPARNSMLLFSTGQKVVGRKPPSAGNLELGISNSGRGGKQPHNNGAMRDPGQTPTSLSLSILACEMEPAVHSLHTIPAGTEGDHGCESSWQKINNVQVAHSPTPMPGSSWGAAPSTACTGLRGEIPGGISLGSPGSLWSAGEAGQPSQSP